MAKIAVVYYSMTGNTETMAEKVAEGARAKGAEVSVFTAGEFNSGLVGDFDAIAFGCSAYGAEQLEEGEFEPMFNEVEPSLAGKKLGLFGSYDWGDGEWMRTWKENCENDGATVVDTVIANLTPDDEALAACIKLGESLA